MKVAILAGGVLLLTSPWWITMLNRHGLDPYLSIAGTVLHGFGYAVALFTPLSGEPFLTIIAILAVLGAVVQIARKDYLLPMVRFSLFSGTSQRRELLHFPDGDAGQCRPDRVDPPHLHIPVMSHTESGPCRTVRGEKSAVVGIVL